MFSDFAIGKILTKGGLPNGPPDLPPVTEWNAFFGKGNKRWMPGQGIDVHHCVETWIQQDYLLLPGGYDDVPGRVIDTTQHTFGKGEVKLELCWETWKMRSKEKWRLGT